MNNPRQEDLTTNSKDLMMGVNLESTYQIYLNSCISFLINTYQECK